MAFSTRPGITASFALYILKGLRESPETFQSAADLVRYAVATFGEDQKAEEQRNFFINPEAHLQFAQNILRDFAQLGLVESVQQGEQTLFRGTFGNGPPPGGGGGDGQLPGGGGSGMAAVLAHKILFAMDEEDFGAAVDRSLEIY